MLKFFGAALIIVSGFAVGAAKYASLKRGVAVLYELVASLEIMRGEIVSRLTPLPELMSMLEGRGLCGCFFGEVYRGLSDMSGLTFREIWNAALPCLDALSAEDAAVLSSLGAVLGRYDAREQEAAINRVSARLTLSAKRGSERLPGAGKLYIGLGAGLCAMLAVVLT